MSERADLKLWRLLYRSDFRGDQLRHTEFFVSLEEARQRSSDLEKDGATILGIMRVESERLAEYEAW